MTDISIHDNLLLSCTVWTEKHEIRLETVFRDVEHPENTDVVFADVLAYHLENDSFGTILFDVTEISTESIYTDYRDLFEQGRRYGWPGAWSENTEAYLAYLGAENITGYYISAAIGMTGWVLAKEMRLEKRI